MLVFYYINLFHNPVCFLEGTRTARIKIKIRICSFHPRRPRIYIIIFISFLISSSLISAVNEKRMRDVPSGTVGGRTGKA